MADILGIGIDPGIKNLGFSIVKKIDPFKVVCLYCNTFSLDEEEDFIIEALNLADHLKSLIALNYSSSDYGRVFVGIERFVSYAGIKSSSQENIAVLIGVICSALDSIFPGIRRSAALPVGHLLMPRAFEWKNELVRNLAKNTDFSNPRQNLDKGFSVAAARFICQNSYMIKNDHEADATCIASYKLLGTQSGKEKQAG